MNLSDTELMLLEQLTYIGDLDDMVNKSKDCKKPVKYNAEQTVGEFLDNYDEEVLNSIEKKKTVEGAQTSGKEWSRIIKTLKKNKKLCSLKMQGKTTSETSSEYYAISFKDPDKKGKSYVAFKGTLNIEEWEDNLNGLSVSDTKCQKEALRYINSLDSDDITVVGHSKGGNKAMYVAFLSDKVTRCVTLDAQGFSEYFYDKYWMEVKKKSKIITQYAVAEDFVNILLFQPPGVKTHYLKGYGMDGMEEFHSPNSPFGFDSKGNVVLTETKQNVTMKHFHGFSCFLSNTMPLEDKRLLAPYLGSLVGLSCSGEDGWVTYKGQTYYKKPGKGQNGLKQLIGSEPRLLAKILAYTLKYCNEYKMDWNEINSILKLFGINIDFKLISEAVGGVVVASSIAIMLPELATLFSTYETLKLSDKVLGLYAGSGINLPQFEAMLLEEYISIPEFNHNTANLNVSIRSERIVDFSKEAYDAIIDAIERMPKPINDYNWSKYASEDWYDELGVAKASAQIEEYYDDLEGYNRRCKRKVEEVFETEIECYANHAKLVQKLTKKLAKTRRELQILNGSLTV